MHLTHSLDDESSSPARRTRRKKNIKEAVGKRPSTRGTPPLHTRLPFSNNGGGERDNGGAAPPRVPVVCDWGEVATSADGVALQRRCGKKHNQPLLRVPPSCGTACSETRVETLSAKIACAPPSPPTTPSSYINRLQTGVYWISRACTFQDHSFPEVQVEVRRGQRWGLAAQRCSGAQPQAVLILFYFVKKKKGGGGGEVGKERNQ